MANELLGKVAIVTGGASGIGEATSRLFVTEGARVVVADRDDGRGRAVATDLGADAIFVRVDVAEEPSIAHLVDATVSAFGRLDIMVNNAGIIGDLSPIVESEAAGFQKTMAVVASSVWWGHKYAARQFIRQNSSGAIVSTLSTAALQAGWSPPAYTVAKHAVHGIIRQATLELAARGIRSNGVAPGVTLTPIMLPFFGVPEEKQSTFFDFIDEKAGHHLPLGRGGRSEDMANAALFLASDRSSYVSGVLLPVDGGASAVYSGGFAPAQEQAAKQFVADNAL